jgi:uncharacterized RDD family membrane protein YckC
MNGSILTGEIMASQLDDIRLYDGVRTRRVMAFVADYVIVALLMVPVAIAVFLLGLVTFGIGWALFGALFPLVALAYIWMTLGGPNQATPGMRMMSIRIARLDGRPVDGLVAVVHSVLFWAGNVLLTPLILLVTLFTDRKRALHDLLLGTVIVRSDR